jgi:hypothetical protein
MWIKKTMQGKRKDLRDLLNSYYRKREGRIDVFQMKGWGSPQVAGVPFDFFVE